MTAWCATKGTRASRPNQLPAAGWPPQSPSTMAGGGHGRTMPDASSAAYWTGTGPDRDQGLCAGRPGRLQRAVPPKESSISRGGCGGQKCAHNDLAHCLTAEGSIRTQHCGPRCGTCGRHWALGWGPGADRGCRCCVQRAPGVPRLLLPVLLACGAPAGCQGVLRRLERGGHPATIARKSPGAPATPSRRAPCLAAVCFWGFHTCATA
jgi:hypothetical protein